MLQGPKIIGRTRQGRPVFSIAGGAGDDAGGAPKGDVGDAGGEPQVGEDGRVNVSKEAWENVRGAAERGSEAAKEAARLKRENAVLKSVPGADLEAEDVKKLIGSDLDDDTVVNMIRSLTKPGEQAAPENPEIPADERGSTGERAGLAAGAEAGGDEGQRPNPHEDAVAAFHEHVKQGGKKDDGFALAISKVMSTDDPRALVPPEHRADLAELMRGGMGQ
jgi:hypothetical protein